MDRNTEKRYDEGIYAFDALRDEINRLEEEISSLQDRYGDLEATNSTLQDMVHDLEDNLNRITLK